MYLHTFLVFKNSINISLYRIFKLFMCMCKCAQMPAEARRAGTSPKLPSKGASSLRWVLGNEVQSSAGLTAKVVSDLNY